MNLYQRLLHYGKKQSFQPNLFSLFLNPFFFIRRGLYVNIRKEAAALEGTLLDFGCGRKPYKSLFHKIDQYVGVDIEVSGHSHQESEVDVFYDGKTLPFENDKFDTFFSSEVFEHVFNLDDILQEIYRVMKPGARGLITIPFSWPEHEKPYDYARYTSFAIKDILERNGFVVKKIIKSGHFAEAIFQLIIGYIHQLFYTKNRLMNTLLTIILISPFNIIGLILLNILPKNHDLYHNSIVLFEKELNET